MGPGREPGVCENDELVQEFELACRAGDYEFAEEYKKELLKRLGVKCIKCGDTGRTVRYGNSSIGEPHLVYSLCVCKK